MECTTDLNVGSITVSIRQSSIYWRNSWLLGTRWAAIILSWKCVEIGRIFLILELNYPTYCAFIKIYSYAVLYISLINNLYIIPCMYYQPPQFMFPLFGDPNEKIKIIVIL